MIMIGGPVFTVSIIDSGVALVTEVMREINALRSVLAATSHRHSGHIVITVVPRGPGMILTTHQHVTDALTELARNRSGVEVAWYNTSPPR